MLSTSFHTKFSGVPSNWVTAPCNTPRSILTNSPQSLLMNSKTWMRPTVAFALLALLKQALFILLHKSINIPRKHFAFRDFSNFIDLNRLSWLFQNCTKQLVPMRAVHRIGNVRNQDVWETCWEPTRLLQYKLQILSKHVFPVPSSQVVTQGSHKHISKLRQYTFFVASPCFSSGATQAFLTKLSVLAYFSRSWNNEGAYGVQFSLPTGSFFNRDCSLISLSCCW